MTPEQREHLRTNFDAFVQHYFAARVPDARHNQSLIALVEQRILGKTRPVAIAPRCTSPEHRAIIMIAALWSLEYEHDRAVRIICRDERSAELLKEAIAMELDFYNEAARQLSLKPKTTSWGIVFDRELLLAITPAPSLTPTAEEWRYTLILHADVEEDDE